MLFYYYSENKLNKFNFFAFLQMLTYLVGMSSTNPKYLGIWGFSIGFGVTQVLGAKTNTKMLIIPEIC